MDTNLVQKQHTYFLKKKLKKKRLYVDSIENNRLSDGNIWTELQQNLQ